MNARSCIFLFAFFSSMLACYAQKYHRADTIPVKENGNWLKMPWVGGHNYCQLSAMDINQDGIEDLFLFDRTGHKITTYINGGTPNTVDYYDSSAWYAPKFPHLEDWVLLRDFNCDGKTDIFTYGISVGGIKVWKNTSTPGHLQFTLQTPYIVSNYGSSSSNLYCTRVDLPTIEDIDGDGDLDVLTMDFSATYLEYHINKSKELGYGCDSLIFQLDQGGCWGNFNESQTGCTVHLNVNCRRNTHFYDSLIASSPTGLLQPNPLAQHSGNCSVCFDNNGDGAKEVLLGQLGCCNLNMLTNGGTPSGANMTARDSSFPSYSIPASLPAFPCGFFLDVNNDKKRDLIVCPNLPNISIDNESIWYYENTGTDSVPVFTRRTRSLFQKDMIDVGSGADPVFFDYDHDGLSDLILSNYSMLFDTCMAVTRTSYDVRAYKNTGTSAAPKFELATNNFANLSGQLPNLSGKHLTFGDLDGDGAQDMMVGDYNGYIHYFKNTGGAGPANFVLATPNYPDSAGNPINVGYYATPQLVDADRDGDLDLLIGKRSGTLSYYRNIGTPSSPSFKLITAKFGGIHVLPGCCTGYTVPFMYDSAGSYRLFVGTEASRTFTPPMGWIWYFKNIDGNLSGNFTLVDSMYQNIWEGERMAVNGKDINGDGKIDLAVGNFCGGVAIYLNDSSTTGVAELHSEPFDFEIYPNPSRGNFNLKISLPMAIGIENLKMPTITVCNVYGEEVYAISDFQILKFSNFQIDLPSGVYYCTLKTNSYTKTKKFIIIK